MHRYLRIVLALLLSSFCLSTNAQEAAGNGGSTGIIKGRLVGATTGQPVTDVQLTIPALKQLVNSDAEGNFSFSRVPYGTHMVILGGNSVKTDTLKINVHDAVADLKDVIVSFSDSSATPLNSQIPVIALE